MTRGKRTCRILKDIRRQIAEANGIDFVTSECRFKGDCLGTCPKCEAEVRYLEEQLRARSLSGKAVALAGLSAGMLLFSGCSPKQVETNPTPVVMTDSVVEEMGENYIPEDTLPEVVPAPEEVKSSAQVTELLLVGEDENYDDSEDCSFSRRFYDDSTPSNVADVDVEPQFPGGRVALNEWLHENMNYPEEAIADRVSGRVTLRFIIEKDGSISNIDILKSAHWALENEATRLLNSMPDWAPGTIDGEPVRVSYTLPITFRLPVE